MFLPEPRLTCCSCPFAQFWGVLPTRSDKGSAARGAGASAIVECREVTVPGHRYAPATWWWCGVVEAASRLCLWNSKELDGGQDIGQGAIKPPFLGWSGSRETLMDLQETVENHSL